jgi:hypothetical protein
VETIELPLSPALRSLLLCSECACVYDCCGLAAFEFHHSIARAWVRRFGAYAIDDTIAHLDEVATLCADATRKVSCATINESTWDAEHRDTLVAFFRDLQERLRRV